MKLRLLLPLVGLFTTCHHTYDDTAEYRAQYAARQAAPSQTISVELQACTGCTETGMRRGLLPLPVDLRATLGDSLLQDPDVKLVGRFPQDLLDYVAGFSYELYGEPHDFVVVGKVIGTFNNGGLVVPLFYVESWQTAPCRREENNEKAR